MKSCGICQVKTGNKPFVNSNLGLAECCSIPLKIAAPMNRTAPFKIMQFFIPVTLYITFKETPSRINYLSAANKISHLLGSQTNDLGFVGYFKINLHRLKIAENYFINRN